MLGLSVTFFPKHNFTNYSKYNKTNNKTTYITKKRKLSSIIEVPDRQYTNVKNIKIKETVIVPSELKPQSEPLNHIYLSEIKNIRKENDTLQKENDTFRKENDTLQKENDTLRKENDILRKENDILRKENDTLRNIVNIYQTNYIHQ